MHRVAILSAVSLLTPLSLVRAQEERPVPVPSRAPTAQPAVAGSRGGPGGAVAPVTPAPAKAEPAAYYPPPGSLQPPLTAADVCRYLRSGLSGAEVAQDVRERGFTGSFSADEAADARAAGGTPDFIAALQSGRFTVSAAYARRHDEEAAKGRRTVEANAWRAEAAARAQAAYRESELHRQGQIAAENNRAIAAKEYEDKRRFEEMKDKADWESRQRQAQNANDGWWYGGRWYRQRRWANGSWQYY